MKCPQKVRQYFRRNCSSNGKGLLSVESRLNRSRLSGQHKKEACKSELNRPILCGQYKKEACKG